MTTDATIGLAVIGFALAVLIGLVLWSRRRIERISRNGFASARQIEKGLDE